MQAEDQDGSIGQPLKLNGMGLDGANVQELIKEHGEPQAQDWRPIEEFGQEVKTYKNSMKGEKDIIVKKGMSSKKKLGISCANKNPATTTPKKYRSLVAVVSPTTGSRSSLFLSNTSRGGQREGLDLLNATHNISSDVWSFGKRLGMGHKEGDEAAMEFLKVMEERDGGESRAST